MGIGGISIGSLVLILLIILVLFGAKRLRNLGSDFGAAIRSFKDEVGKGQENEPVSTPNEPSK